MSTRPAYPTHPPTVGAAQPALSAPRVPSPIERPHGWLRAALVLRVLLSVATLAPLVLATAHTPQPDTHTPRPGSAHHVSSDAGTARGAGLAAAARRSEGSSRPSVQLAAFSEPLRPEAQPAHGSSTANTGQPVAWTNRTVRASRCSGSVLLGDPGGSGMSVGGVGLTISLGADPADRGWSRTERGCTHPSSDNGSDDTNDHHHPRWAGGRDDCGCPGRWNAPPPARPGQPSLDNPSGYPTYPTYPTYPGATGWPTGPTFPNTSYPTYPNSSFPGASYPNTGNRSAGYPYTGYQGGVSWPDGTNPCARYPSGSAPILDPTGRLVCVRPSNPTAGSGLGVGINLGGW